MHFNSYPVLFRKVGVLGLILFSPVLFSAVQAQEWIKTGIIHTINAEFDQAITVYQNEINARPEDFRAHFYLAAALSSKMIHFENREGEQVFDQAINKTIELIQDLLQSEPVPSAPDLAQLWFYLGSAYGYRAYDQGRTGKWLAAFSNGMKATGYLQDAVREDSTLYDAYLGIGTYKYWRTSKLGFIYWLPFLADEREDGILMIKKVAESDCLSQDLARHQLVYILLDYGKFEEALTYARQLAADFPQSQFMHWALAHACYKSEQYKDAEKAYLYLEQLIEHDPHRNLNHLLNCKLKLALIYLALQDDTNCLGQCTTLIELYRGYPDKEKFGKMDQVEKIMEQIHRKNPPPVQKPG
jgi:tetratricopeptide (TPR) repeat protein